MAMQTDTMQFPNDPTPGVGSFISQYLKNRFGQDLLTGEKTGSTDGYEAASPTSPAPGTSRGGATSPIANSDIYSPDFSLSKMMAQAQGRKPSPFEGAAAALKGANFGPGEPVMKGYGPTWGQNFLTGLATGVSNVGAYQQKEGDAQEKLLQTLALAGFRGQPKPETPVQASTRKLNEEYLRRIRAGETKTPIDQSLKNSRQARVEEIQHNYELGKITREQRDTQLLIEQQNADTNVRREGETELHDQAGEEHAIAEEGIQSEGNKIRGRQATTGEGNLEERKRHDLIEEGAKKAGQNPITFAQKQLSHWTGEFNRATTEHDNVAAARAKTNMDGINEYLQKNGPLDFTSTGGTPAKPAGGPWPWSSNATPEVPPTVTVNPKPLLGQLPPPGSTSTIDPAFQRYKTMYPQASDAEIKQQIEADNAR